MKKFKAFVDLKEETLYMNLLSLRRQGLWHTKQKGISKNHNLSSDKTKLEAPSISQRQPQFDITNLKREVFTKGPFKA